jgi:hypothetical protein
MLKKPSQTATTATHVGAEERLPATRSWRRLDLSLLTRCVTRLGPTGVFGVIVVAVHSASIYTCSGRRAYGSTRRPPTTSCIASSRRCGARFGPPSRTWSSTISCCTRGSNSCPCSTSRRLSSSCASPRRCSQPSELSWSTRSASASPVPSRVLPPPSYTRPTPCSSTTLSRPAPTAWNCCCSRSPGTPSS